MQLRLKVLPILTVCAFLSICVLVIKYTIKQQGTTTLFNDARLNTGRSIYSKYTNPSKTFSKGFYNYTTFNELCPKNRFINYVKFDPSFPEYKYNNEIEEHFESSFKCSCPETDTTGKEQRLPQAIIIGVEKAGTTALRFFLDEHPDIVFPQLCDVQFFDSDRYDTWGLEWYRRNMGFSKPDQVTMEKSPMYYRVSEVSARRIYNMNNTVKLLVVVREPLSRTLSDYIHHSLKRSLNESFESHVLLPNGELNTKYQALSRSVYHKRLKIWLDIFPRKQILIVDGDRLGWDLIGEMKRVEEFLGVRRFITEENVVFVENRGTHGLFCMKINMPNVQAYCLGSEKGRVHPKLSEDLKKRFKDYFAPHNREFYQMVDREFNWSA